MGERTEKVQGVTSIVLAGGKSRRLGRNKAMECVGSEQLISTVIGKLSQLTEKTVVVVASLDDKAKLRNTLPSSVETLVDIYPRAGAFGGIYTGLTLSNHPWGLVVACDMPFLNLGLLQHMLSVRKSYDVVVPMLDGLPEPLHALYSKACLPRMERQIQAGELKIAHFINEVRVNYLSQQAIEDFDREHLSFFNVNTQSDLEMARYLSAERT